MNYSCLNCYLHCIQKCGKKRLCSFRSVKKLVSAIIILAFTIVSLGSISEQHLQDLIVGQETEDVLTSMREVGIAQATASQVIQTSARPVTESTLQT